MYSDDELLPLSGLQHLAYCERQWALIHLEQLWQDSGETMKGNQFHERIDFAGYSTRDGVVSHRGVRLVSRELGLYGIADIVEEELDSTGMELFVPVEYKVGKPKVEDWDRVQVAAQSLCLEEMWHTKIDDTAIFYGKTRHREYVNVDEGLRMRVQALVVRMHALFSEGKTPLPGKASLCKRCSLHDACLPEAGRKSVQSYWKDMGEEIAD